MTAQRKLVWKVSDVPAGRFRRFEQRGWPTLHWDSKDGKPAAFLHCEEEYRPADVKAGCVRGFKVSICHHTHPAAGNSWQLLKCTLPTAMTLEAVKALVESQLRAHPEYAPQPKMPAELVAQPAKCCGTCRHFSIARVESCTDDRRWTEPRCAVGTLDPKPHHVCAKHEDQLK